MLNQEENILVLFYTGTGNSEYVAKSASKEIM